MIWGRMAEPVRSVFDIDDEEDNDNLMLLSVVQEVEKTNSVTNKSNVVVASSSPPCSSKLASSTSKASSTNSSKMDAAGRARCERNRLKALALKRARLQSASAVDDNRSKVLIKEKKLVDTDAGFFIEEDENTNEESDLAPIKHLPAPIVEPDQPLCLECRGKMADSYLLRTFDLTVCDKCRDTEREGKHELITKTEAKAQFLMSDHHLETLKFVVRKNPHNERWGDMKLFLRMQVEERALEVWGSEEALEAAHVERDTRRDRLKSRKMQRQIKALRMQVRGSLYQKDLSKHEHEYGEESYDESSDEYSRTCTSCGHVHKYEKM